MIIDGDFTIQAPIQQVWDFLIDIPKMSTCMPGVESLELSGESTYKGMVTIKVGPIATSFQGDVELVEQEEPKFLKAKLQGHDHKTSSMVTGEFSAHIKPLAENSTQIDYQFDLKIRGRLGQFGQAVIQDTARQLTNEFVNCLRSRVENPEDPPNPAPSGEDLVSIAFRSFFSYLWSSLRKALGAKN
jgi:carbon monoxide dehydrogenase subunit G